jgi:chromosome segregation ATPase
MHLQKNLKQRICDLEADKAQVEARMESASARCTEAEQQLEAAERQLTAQERSNEKMHQQLTSLRASYIALSDELQAEARKASAATERAAALENELSDTQVSGALSESFSL